MLPPCGSGPWPPVPWLPCAAVPAPALRPTVVMSPASRVEDPGRVERGLDPAQQRHLVRPEPFGQVRQLRRADAVLAGDRAVHPDRRREDLAEGLVGPLDRRRRRAGRRRSSGAGCRRRRARTWPPARRARAAIASIRSTISASRGRGTVASSRIVIVPSRDSAGSEHRRASSSACGAGDVLGEGHLHRAGRGALLADAVQVAVDDVLRRRRRRTAAAPRRRRAAPGGRTPRRRRCTWRRGTPASPARSRRR